MDSYSVKTLRAALFALLVSGVFFAVISQFTSIDVNIEDYYYDAQIHQFIWKNSWFAKQLMHSYVKNVIIVLALLLIIVVVVDIAKPISKISAWTRIRLRFVTVAAIVIPSFISSAKQLSVMHCPWDVERYGGVAPYLRLFDMMPAQVEAGHCFPAGHASTGLWLAAFCVFWLPCHPRKALLVFLAGLGVGFVLGWVQQMRGAHFLSHTLWSLWIASAIILLMLCLSQSFINRH
jgi:membrane-associated PAP2 superfamily phosphatase